MTFVPVGLDDDRPRSSSAVEPMGRARYGRSGAPAVVRVAGASGGDPPHRALLPLLVASVADLLDATGCAVSIPVERGGRRVVGTADAFERIVAAQSASGAGPDLEACRTGKVVATTDVATRALDWPVYVGAALSEGIRAVPATPMGSASPAVGVLVAYGAGVRAWTMADVSIAEAFARLGGAYLTVSRHLDEAEHAASGLKHALMHNAVIEQAKGARS